MSLSLFISISLLPLFLSAFFLSSSLLSFLFHLLVSSALSFSISVWCQLHHLPPFLTQCIHASSYCFITFVPSPFSPITFSRDFFASLHSKLFPPHPLLFTLPLLPCFPPCRLWETFISFQRSVTCNRSVRSQVWMRAQAITRWKMEMCLSDFFLLPSAAILQCCTPQCTVSIMLMCFNTWEQLQHSDWLQQCRNIELSIF